MVASHYVKPAKLIKNNKKESISISLCFIQI